MESRIDVCAMMWAPDNNESSNVIFGGAGLGGCQPAKNAMYHPLAVTASLPPAH